MNKPISCVAAALLSLAAAGASAQSTTFYVGGAFIDVNSSAPALSGGDPVPPPGAQIEVDDASTVGFGLTYRFNPSWSVEAALGIPPRHRTYGAGFIEPFGQISSVKQVAPTVFVNYHLGGMGQFEPFVGLGLNSTRFTGARSTPSGVAASGGPTRIELDDSWGAAVHVGASYKINDKWSIVGTIAYADVQSDLKATTTTNEGDVVRTTHIKFNPVAYTLSVGYSF